MPSSIYDAVQPEGQVGRASPTARASTTRPSTCLRPTGRRPEGARDEHGFDMLVDVSARRLGASGQRPRFTVVYHVFSTRAHEYVRVAADCAERGRARGPERHRPLARGRLARARGLRHVRHPFRRPPDLRRILMWDGYPHFPLRKDFPLAGIETSCRTREVVAETKTGAIAAPMMGGPFVASAGEHQHDGGRAPRQGRELDRASPETRTPENQPAMPAEFAFPDSAAKAAHGRSSRREKMSLSMGPSHPSTHGVLRIQMELDGEVVTKADPVIGYLHRGDEKIAENMTYNQFVPYTDRLDYLAPLANNMAYAIAVEKLAKLEVPPRCQAIRVITARDGADLGAPPRAWAPSAIDVGAWTVFLYSFTEREKLYKLFEELTGARFTTSYTRIGGSRPRRARRAGSGA